MAVLQSISFISFKSSSKHRWESYRQALDDNTNWIGHTDERKPERIHNKASEQAENSKFESMNQTIKAKENDTL